MGTFPWRRVTIVLASGAALSAGVAGPWSPMDGDVATWLLILGLAAACLVPVAGSVRNGRVDLFEIGVTVGLAYFALFPLRAIVVVAGLDPYAPPPVLDASPVVWRTALTAATLGIAAGGIAYLSRVGPSLAMKVRTSPVELLDHVSLPAAITMFAVGVFAQASTNVASIQFLPGRLGLDTWLAGVTSVLLIIGLFLIANHVITRGRSTAILVVCASIGMAVGMLSQVKETATICVLVPLLAWNFRKTMIGWRTAVVGLATVVMVIFPTTTIIRNASVRLDTYSPAVLLPALPEQFTAYSWLFATAPAPLQASDIITEPLLVVTHRLYGFDALTLAVRVTPEVIPYQLGSLTVTQLASGVVPRLFWPEKPSVGLGLWFAYNYWPIAPGVPVVPQAMTHPGEFWIEFGTIGVAIGLGILGTAYRFMWIVLNPRSSTSGALLYTVAFVTLISVDKDIPLVFITLLQRSAGTGLVLMAMLALQRAAPHRLTTAPAARA